MLTHAAFERWLSAYGAAWRDGDPEAAVRLFTPEAAYHETPFDAPLRGAGAIRRYWTDGAKNAQRDVAFAARVVGVDDDTGHAHWRASFVRVAGGARVELDGVLAARLAADGRCRELREWWHRRETAG